MATMAGALSSARVRVFICYRRSDGGDVALSLYEQLAASGIQAFCDLVDDPNDVLGDRIYDVIAGSNVFLLVATGGALKAYSCEGSWIRKEVRCAQRHGLTILLVRVDDTDHIAERSSTCVDGHVETSVSNGRASTAVVRELMDAACAAGPLHMDNSLASLELGPVEWGRLLAGANSVLEPHWAHMPQTVTSCAERCFDENGTSRCDAAALLELVDHPGLTPYRALICRAIAAGLVRRLSRARGVGRSDLRALWPLLRSAVADGVRVTQSSQGFDVIPLYSVVEQGRLQELLRLHVWTPRTMEMADAVRPFQVHSHQTHLQSWLLLGAIRNALYSVTDMPDAHRGEYSLFRMTWDRSREYSTLHAASTASNVGRRVHIDQESSTIYRQGARYSVAAGAFHSTTVVPRAGAVVAATIAFFDATLGWVEDAPVVGPAMAAYSRRERATRQDPSGLMAAIDHALDVQTADGFVRCMKRR